MAVLTLIALFTHNHAYWIAALMLALIRLPDFTTPLTGMASSLARMAETKVPRPATEAPPTPKRVTKKSAKAAPENAAKETSDV